MTSNSRVFERAGKALILATVLAVTLSTTSSGRQGRDDLSMVGTTTLASRDLRVGDCVVSVPKDDVTFVEAVPCLTPHRGEVIANVPLPRGDFPGDEELTNAGLEHCKQQLRSTRPWALEDASVSLLWLQPTHASWGDDGQDFTCMLVSEVLRRGFYPDATSPRPDV